MSEQEAFLEFAAEHDQFASELDLAYQAKDIAEAGVYTALLHSISNRTFPVRGIDTCVVSVQFCVVNAPETKAGRKVAGQLIGETYWFPRGATQSSMAQQNLIKLGRLVNDASGISTLGKAYDAIEAACGQVALIVEVVKRKKYWNFVFQQAVPESEMEEVASENEEEA